MKELLEARADRGHPTGPQALIDQIEDTLTGHTVMRLRRRRPSAVIVVAVGAVATLVIVSSAFIIFRPDAGSPAAETTATPTATAPVPPSTSLTAPSTPPATSPPPPSATTRPEVVAVLGEIDALLEQQEMAQLEVAETLLFVAQEIAADRFRIGELSDTDLAALPLDLLTALELSLDERPATNAELEAIDLKSGEIQKARGAILLAEAEQAGLLGPELDGFRLPALPPQVIVVAMHQQLAVLVGTDGTVFGHVPGAYVDWTTGSIAGIGDGGVPAHVRTYPSAIDESPEEPCVISRAVGEAAYFICDDSTTVPDDVVARGEIRLRSSAGTEERLAGPAYVFEADGKPIVAGHWRYLLLAPDGGELLGQWSGECEVLSAHFIRHGTALLGLGEEQGHESFALGWTPDGQAIVTIGSSACSLGDAEGSGVYLAHPDADSTLIYPYQPEGVSVYLWERT